MHSVPLSTGIGFVDLVEAEAVKFCLDNGPWIINGTEIRVEEKKPPRKDSEGRRGSGMLDASTVLFARCVLVQRKYVSPVMLMLDGWVVPGRGGRGGSGRGGERGERGERSERRDRDGNKERSSRRE